MVKKRILIVEDSPHVRKLLRVAFEKNGFDIVGEAQDGKEAISKYSALRPDLVTMDLLVPIVDNITGADAVRKILDEFPDARVVIISALSEKTLDDTTLSKIKFFVNKPFEPADLIRYVNEALK